MTMQTTLSNPKKSIGLSILLGFSFILFSVSSVAQELRFGLDAQIMGTINGAFVGPTLGLEGSISDRFAVSVDFTSAYGRVGRLRTTKPGIQYYFKDGRRGFFIGAHLKYLRLKEKSELDLYDDRLFATGFSIGVKGRLGNQTDLLIQASPHVTAGGRDEADVAGVGVFVGISHQLNKK